MPVADWSYLGNGVALVPYYASMTPASAVDIRATAGSIDFNSLQAQGNLFAYGMQHNRTNYSVSYANTTPSILLPASLSLVAFDGSIDIGHGGGLYPSLDGDLTLIADGDITLASIVKSSDGSTWIGNIDSRVLELLSYPADSGILPTPLAPQTVYYDNESTQYVATSPTANSINDPSLLAASDTVRIYSLNGGISDGIELSDGTATAELAIVSNRPAQIYAADDITDLSFYGQNLSDTDITAIIAGGDIVYHPISTAVTQVQYYSLTALAPEIDISGPGMLDVEAGGDIIFPSQRAKSGIETGIRTLGNSLDTGTAIGTFGNPYLEQGGASVNVLFGVGKGVDYASFISTYVDPTDGSAILADEPLLLTGFVEKYAKKSNLTADQAWILFQALPAAQQHLFVEQVFFDVLNETGLDYNNPASTYYHKYDRGYQAINTLFPSGLGYTANNLTGGTNGANAFVHTGNLDLRGSTIQTQQGGDISLVGPGGTILVGTQLAAPSFITPQMEGIITIENGNIRTFTDTSVEVAQSRVMTEQGGDILMWSSNGDLDAGKGAKTSFAFPPPVYSCDNDWYCVVDTKGLVTGAGIASLQTLPDSSIGNANLIAPRGTVDAGAAGIRVSGNLNIAALYVANTFNIEVNGTTIGVPTLTTNLNLATVSNASTEAATILDNLKAKEPQNTIDVEVTGFGGDVNQPVECVPNSVHPCKR